MQSTRTSPLFRILKVIVAAAGITLAPQLVAREVIADPYHEYRDEVGRGEFTYDESLETPWVENETEVLAVPRPEDLTEVNVDRLPPGMVLLVDRSRIMVHPEDRVVRVWLWIRSGSGLEKGSFEGFRCDTWEYKVYAWANPGREPPVTKVKRPVWLSVKGSNAKTYRQELLDHYFCGFREIRNADQIVDALADPYGRDSIQNR